MGSTHYQTARYTTFISLNSPCYLVRSKNKNIYWPKYPYKFKSVFLPDTNDKKYMKALITEEFDNRTMTDAKMVQFNYVVIPRFFLKYQ